MGMGGKHGLELCKVEGCTRPRRYVKEGLCGPHYARKKRGTPNWERPIKDTSRTRKEVQVCSVEGCTLFATAARGFCITHYNRVLKGIDMNIPVKRWGKKDCDQPECERPHSHNGYCELHASRAAKGSQMDAPVRNPGKYAHCQVEGCQRRHEANGYCGTHGYTARRFKLTLEQVNQAVNGVCDICKGKNSAGRALAVDHDHACCPGKRSCGKCVRGFLCGQCNYGVGNFKDDPQLLRKTALYLEQHAAITGSVVN